MISDSKTPMSYLGPDAVAQPMMNLGLSSLDHSYVNPGLDNQPMVANNLGAHQLLAHLAAVSQEQPQNLAADSSLFLPSLLPYRKPVSPTSKPSITLEPNNKHSHTNKLTPPAASSTIKKKLKKKKLKNDSPAMPSAYSILVTQAPVSQNIALKYLQNKNIKYGFFNLRKCDFQEQTKTE